MLVVRFRRLRRMLLVRMCLSRAVRALHDLRYMFWANDGGVYALRGVPFLRRMTDLHGVPASRPAPSLTTHLILARGYRWRGLPPVCIDRFLPDSNVFALACNYRWSNWLRHEVSSWRLVLSRTCEAACRRFSGGSK